MQTRPVPNRWFVVLGAILIQLSLGAIYAWSVFTPALKAAGWSKLETQIVFAVGLASFAVVMVFALRSVLSGLLAMIPNLFPMLLLFGAMGWKGQAVDIGTVMTASVALGIAGSALSGCLKRSKTVRQLRQPQNRFKTCSLEQISNRGAGSNALEVATWAAGLPVVGDARVSSIGQPL